MTSRFFAAPETAEIVGTSAKTSPVNTGRSGTISAPSVR
jgi:hypothetical protein